MENSPSIYASDVVVQAKNDKGQLTNLLYRISFEVPSGQFVAIIGASGCGKSTLVRTLGGMIHPSFGQILLAGHPVDDLKQAFPLAVGYLPQFASFHDELTVAENLSHAVALRLPNSVPHEVKQSWVEHIIELARIRPLLHQPYRTLSGGQMRRIALAEELIGDPPFLLLDELTSGLDPFSDREMMHWLRDLAHSHGKTIILVTHSINYLDNCDTILFLHKGRLIHSGPLADLLESHQAQNVTDLYEIYQTNEFELSEPATPIPKEVIPQALKTARPPSGWGQFLTLLSRQVLLFVRDRSQILLHIVLILTFPALVAVFAYKGLPQVRSLEMSLERNFLKAADEAQKYLVESVRAAAVISGLAMFQVVLLTLIGANNGAREIAKEIHILTKELRAGLSPFAYVITKFLQIFFLSFVQAFWMAWFVKSLCGFPGDLLAQFVVLFATTLSMSTICLAISAYAPSPERASLLSIYLVGFQLPLSGAALALPIWLSNICQPFIAAYWGWSGYLQSLSSYRQYDIVKQSTKTMIAPYFLCIGILTLHVILGLFLAWYFVRKRRLQYH